MTALAEAEQHEAEAARWLSAAVLYEHHGDTERAAAALRSAEGEDRKARAVLATATGGAS